MFSKSLFNQRPLTNSTELVEAFLTLEWLYTLMHLCEVGFSSTSTISHTTHTRSLPASAFVRMACIFTLVYLRSYILRLIIWLGMNNYDLRKIQIHFIFIEDRQPEPEADVSEYEDLIL